MPASEAGPARSFEDQLAEYSRVLDATEDGLIVLDADWLVTAWNMGAERIYGWTADEVIGRRVSDFADLEMSEAQRAAVRRATAEHGRWRGDIVAHRKDGVRVDVELITVAMEDGYGEPAGYLGIHRDIGERKRAEDDLRAAQQRSDTILERVTDAFYALDHEWRFTYMNARAVRFASQLAGADFTLEGLLGKTLWETLPVMVGTPIEGIYQRALRSQAAVTFEYAYPGEGPLLDVHAYPSDQGLSIYFRDITEQEHARDEHEQRALQQEAVAALGLQALSNHDLETIMDEAAATVARTLDVGLVSVAEIVAGGETLVVRAGYGWGNGSVGRVAAEGPQSALSVLIAGRDGPFGALGAFSREARAFSATDVNFLQAVANVIATAVERADAERTVRELRDAERSPRRRRQSTSGAREALMKVTSCWW
jgi:PAS domain S-box-containing protein